MAFRRMRVIAMLPLFSFPALSQAKNNDEDKCCCTTFDTGQCLIRVTQGVDAKLNDAYKKALKKWADRPGVISKLRDAQRAWITYRDANCESEHRTYDGGTMGPNMYGFCQIRLTRQRIQEIKYIYLSEH
jgi:uncharacterized protein YecT (DUF1311 family)